MTYEERALYCIEQAEKMEAELPPRDGRMPPSMRTAAEILPEVWRGMAARLREAK